MEQKLNKRELKYLAPAVLYGWDIEKSSYDSKGYWDGDRILPVVVGKMAEKLITQGYLKEISLFPNHLQLRATEKATSLKCRDCHQGSKINENDERIGECPVCNGIGLVNQAGTNSQRNPDYGTNGF
ncbi:hypothetical protein K6U37_11220 [Vibrio parahaemolyticus]|uniref:hypothetical protein n=1 Tax=Vibrio parahaemolyticus TaxID=670 RepID=UPI001EEC484F|nr:hypothetical protein [Vibrio parahaemolyticus]MCG6489528.1 hypothetical protein [Vibrio parahaemolyticus]